MSGNSLYISLGVVLLGLGTAGWTWFLRNASRRRVNHAWLYRHKKREVAVGCFFLTIAGYAMTRGSQAGLALAFIVGLVVGLVVSEE